MTIEEIKELIRVVQESGIAELEVSRGDDRVRIRRSNGAMPQEILLPTAPVIAAPLPAVGSVGTLPPSPLAAGSSSAQTAAPAPDNLAYIKSPIVGTYYDSPSPGTPPFVKAGDHVSAGQVLCIIESMKLMNDIESEVAGTVVSKLVDNGKPVEYGQSLFAIQPA